MSITSGVSRRKGDADNLIALPGALHNGMRAIMTKYSAKNNISERPRKKVKLSVLCFFCVIGALFLAVIILAAANFSVLRLVYSPENIVISAREESVETLERLESSGEVRNLVISEDESEISFSSANESVKISSEYDDERLMRVSGNVDASLVDVSTIEEVMELARAALSPYLSDAAITAILLRYSPEIIAGFRDDDIDLTFDIGGDYQVKVTGSARGVIDFSVTAHTR